MDHHERILRHGDTPRGHCDNARGARGESVDRCIDRPRMALEHMKNSQCIKIIAARTVYSAKHAGVSWNFLEIVDESLRGKTAFADRVIDINFVIIRAPCLNAKPTFHFEFSFSCG